MFWILTTLLAVIHSALPCGEEVVLAKGEKYVISSPNYPNPLPGLVNCLWRIRTESTGGFNLACPSIDMIHSQKCILSEIGIFAGTDHLTFCNRRAINVSIDDTQSFVFMFSSIQLFSDNNIYSGFSCTVSLKEDLSSGGVTEAPEPTVPEPTQPAVPQPSHIPGVCGINKPTKKTDGELAELQEYPWHAVLRWNSGRPFCGGTLISQNFVLTASHCLVNLEANKFLISVVEHEIVPTIDGPRTINMRASEIIIHEHYNKHTSDNDIGLLRLARGVGFNDAIMPACLPYAFDDNIISGEKGIVTSWGDTVEDGWGSITLQVRELPLLTSNECLRYLPKNITDNMICTNEAGKDSSQGDSGGPLVWNKAGLHFLVGVVSSGVGHGKSQKLEVYTKVMNYLDWIELKTRKDFC